MYELVRHEPNKLNPIDPHTMALKPCPDCGKPLSSQAPTCPNCGRETGVRSFSPTRVIVALAIIFAVCFALYLLMMTTAIQYQ